MSIQSENRSFSNTPTPYQKLTLRLTPVINDQKGIIRISANNTPTTNNDAINSAMYDRITKHQLGNQSQQSRVFTSNLSASLQRDNTAGIGAKLIRSEVTNSSRNWQLECVALKQTLDYYRSRIIELQNRYQKSGDINRHSTEKESLIYKLKLEETQQRMNQENAYLRQCMTKLNDQLEQTKQIIPSLQKQLLLIKDRNDNLTGQLQEKSSRLAESETGYTKLLDLMSQQKSMGQKVRQRLSQMQWDIQKLACENQRLLRQLDQSRIIQHNLEKVIEQQRSRHKTVLSDCLSMQKEISSHKQHISELQESLSKQRQDYQQFKITMDNESKKSLLLTRSECFVDSISESEPSRLKSSDEFAKYNRSSSISRLRLKKCYSHVITQQRPGTPEFQLKQYQHKIQQFKLLKIDLTIQNITMSEISMKIFDLADYFSQSIAVLLTEKSRLNLLIEKYKRLVQLSWQSPVQQQLKPVEFITDLVEKCNLYESSLYQKKATIDSLQEQLQSLKRESKSKGQKVHYSQREDEIEKQKIIITKLQKEVDILNVKINENSGRQNDDTKIISKNTSTNSINALDKIRAFKPVGLYSKKDINSHCKLKNISGEEIFKQMQSKLKTHEGEVVPELYTKVVEYQRMSNSFEKKKSNQSNVSDDLMQSQVSLFSSSGMNPFNPNNLRRRKIINSISFDNIQLQGSKQSYVFKPEATDSNISNQKKRRLDEIIPEVNLKVLTTLTLKLCEVAQKMIKNNNFAIILPDSIYLINHSQDYVKPLKIRILQTPRSKSLEAKKYWAPQNLKGAPFRQASLVWNIGLLLDQTIHGRLFFRTQEQILDECNSYRFMETSKSVFKNLIKLMLEKDVSRRIHLKQIQKHILSEQPTLFN